ncbi:hypothetical protein ES703_71610 [subsurface metagenome]
MAKTKTPFFSIGAQGSVGESITVQKRGATHLLRVKPLPADPYTLPQAYQRWLYQDYAYVWTQQSLSVKQFYATQGTRFHLTGFQYWMKSHLKDLQNIAAMWQLDDLGNIAHDHGPNANHGTIIGCTPTHLAIDGALSFDGINDEINFGAPPSLDITHSITMEAFIRLDALPSTRVRDFRICGKHNEAVDMYIQKGGNTLRGVFPGLTDNYTSGVGTPLIVGKLYHVAITYNQAYIRTYLDGQLDLQDISTGVLSTSALPFYIGRRANVATEWFEGTIDQCCIYTRALDATELKRHSERRYPA